MTLQIVGLAGEPRQVTAETMDAFAQGLKGSLIHPDGEGYADAISLWNGMIKKRPAVVIRPAGTPDVVRTVKFVRDHELELSIKGGGHNIAGLALSDGGITLDMSRLKGVVVDAERAGGARRSGLHPGRRRSGDPGARPRDDPRLRVRDRRGRADARWRVRLPDPPVRLDGRRPRGGRDRHGRRRRAASVADGERGPLLGTAGRRRQLRRRHGVRLPAPRGRPAGDIRRHRLACRGGRGVLAPYRRSSSPPRAS